MRTRIGCVRSDSTFAMSRYFLVLGFAFAVLLSGASAQSMSVNDQARFLAGLPVRGTALDMFARDRVWVEHASAMDAAWGKQQQRQIAKVRSWAGTFLPDSGSNGTMYYMFSGPDFLYAQAFFPNASTYILCGTEPVGAIPNIANVPRAALHSSLATLRKSLNSVLNWSFFITKDMKVTLTQTQLSGTLPVLYVFLARSGCRIDS